MIFVKLEDWQSVKKSLQLMKYSDFLYRALSALQSNLDFTKNERIILFPFLLLIMLLAVLGNLWILSIIITRKEMRTPYYILVANLVLTDACISIIDMPLTLVALVSNDWPLGENMCSFHAYTVALFFSMNILTITALTAEKYFSLVHPLSQFVTQARCKMAVLLIWCFGLLFACLPLIGWGRYMYNKSTFSCGLAYPATQKERLFYLIILLVLNIVPIVLMLTSYIKVSRVFKAHSKRIRNFARGNSACLSVLKLQKHLVLINSLTLLIFTVCWLPFFLFLALALTIKDMYKLPHGIGTAAYVFSYSASCWNPLLYLLMNTKFRYETISAFESAANCCFYRGRRRKRNLEMVANKIRSSHHEQRYKHLYSQRMRARMNRYMTSSM